MGKLSPEDQERIRSYLVACFDAETMSELEGFGRHVLNNAKVWDMLADLFPDAAPSQLRSVMMEAWSRWRDSLKAPS